MKDWNKRRKENPEEEIWLQEAKLTAKHLKKAQLGGAHLEGAFLIGAHLEAANLFLAHLEGAHLNQTHLEETDLVYAHLEGAVLDDAHLEGATLIGAHLEGTELHGAHLENVNFTKGMVNGSTLFWDCSVDRKTDFRGVGLETCRIDEPTKYLLEYNRRQMNCQDWYKKHPRLACPVKSFFWMSDYGRSTSRIIFTFFGLSIIFANIYYHWGRIAPPGIVSNLFIDENGVVVPWWLVPLRTLYFSIVTMTTLGFGDLYAKSQSIFGHLLLMLQVLLGYVMLGALVTRFGVLFHSGVISGEFTESKKKSKSEQ